MPAYNFQKQFAPLVESGLKRQTIRAKGKRRHACPGEALQLYTGQRTPACRKLLNPDPICTEAQDFVIDESDNIPRIYINGERQNDNDLIARQDGFENYEQMLAWFSKTHGLPFHGVLIKW